MSIHVHLTDEDYIRFNQFCILHSPQGRRVTLPVRLIFPFMCVVLPLIDWLLGEQTFYFFLAYQFLTAAPCVLWVIFSPRLLSLSARRNVRRLKKVGKLPYTADAEFTWDEDSFTETTENSTSRVPLGEIERFYLTRDYAYVFVDTMRGFIIPRFASHPEIEEFIAFLRSRVPCEEVN